MNFFTLLTKILFEDAIGGGTPPVHTTSDSESGEMIKIIILISILAIILILIFMNLHSKGDKK